MPSAIVDNGIAVIIAVTSDESVDAKKSFPLSLSPPTVTRQLVDRS